MNAMNLDSFAAAAGITVYREASCTVSGQSLIDDLLGAELLAALRANDCGDPDAAWPLVHLLLEGTACQWLLTRIDGDGVAYGLCDPGTGHLAVMHTDLPALLIQLAHRRDALRCNPDFRARAPLAEYTRQAYMAGRMGWNWCVVKIRTRYACALYLS